MDLDFDLIFYLLSYVNLLYTNECFFLVCYNELGVVHCTYQGVTGENF